MELEKKLFLIDGHALTYRSYYAFIRNPRINSKGLNTSAILGFVNTLEEILNKENPTHIGVAFDPKGKTFRHEAYKEYKAQREKTPEDIQLALPIIKEIIKAYNIPIIEIEGYEADDVIGTLATKAKENDFKTFMLTPDKDYAQLVDDNVFMYKPKHMGGYEILGNKEIIEKYKIESPKQIIDMLGLMGDTADNIPGCPGVGEKTAQKLIAEFGSIENIIQNCENLKGALKKKIENNIKEIEFSKFLVTIKTDVPTNIKFEELKKEKPDFLKLTEIFEDLEFSTLLKRILNRNNVSTAELQNEKAKKSKNELIQGDLFAQNLNEEVTIVENAPKRTLKDVNKKYYLIDNKDVISNTVEKFLTHNFFAIDTETTNTEPMRAELVGISLSAKKDESFYIPIPADYNEACEIVKLLAPLIENDKITKVGQNIKYDIIVLQKYGVTFCGPLFDTMIAHYVIQPELKHNMDYLAEIYLNYQTIPIEELIGPKGKGQKNMRDLDPKSIYKYACEDADITLQLKEVLEKEIEDNHLNEILYDIELPLIYVLVELECNGVSLDTKALKESSKKLNEKLEDIEKNIYQYSKEEFNISSPKQVGEILFEKLKVVEKAKKTKTGQYVTSEEVLESIKDKHPIIEKILEYRGIKKLLSTYINALPKLINPVTNKIHTSFNQSVTSTGRLSSSNPNLQNIPIRDNYGKEIRKAFIPDKGELFFSADYSQIELRIMAHLSQDKHMIDAFLNDYDIHSATAAKVYQVDIKEVDSDMRRKAKTANFGIIYGISVFGLAERMGVERKEAKALIENYFETYPDIKKYMNDIVDVAKEKGYVTTILGRKRFLPDINSRNAIVRGFAERNAINAPIQGSAADIIKIAMINIYRCIKKEKLNAKMILQVHDELNFSVPKEEKERLEEIVIHEMENAYKMHVPLKVDSSYGNNWLEAH